MLNTPYPPPLKVAIKVIYLMFLIEIPKDKLISGTFYCYFMGWKQTIPGIKYP